MPAKLPWQVVNNRELFDLMPSRQIRSFSSDKLRGLLIRERLACWIKCKSGWTFCLLKYDKWVKIRSLFASTDNWLNCLDFACIQIFVGKKPEIFPHFRKLEDFPRPHLLLIQLERCVFSVVCPYFEWILGLGYKYPKFVAVNVRNGFNWGMEL